jgi:galactokinase
MHTSASRIRVIAVADGTIIVMLIDIAHTAVHIIVATAQHAGLSSSVALCCVLVLIVSRSTLAVAARPRH